jgi:hypothetical protein
LSKGSAVVFLGALIYFVYLIRRATDMVSGINSVSVSVWHAYNANASTSTGNYSNEVTILYLHVVTYNTSCCIDTGTGTKYGTGKIHGRVATSALKKETLSVY